MLADSRPLLLRLQRLRVRRLHAGRPTRTSPLAELGDLADDEVTDESYGPLKALCERAVRDVFGDRALVVRPGLIVGPARPDRPLHVLAAPRRARRRGARARLRPTARRSSSTSGISPSGWSTLCERGLGGTFNADPSGCRVGGARSTHARRSPRRRRLTWVPDEFLVEQEVGEWMELPLWVADPALPVLRSRATSAVRSTAGLAFRPLAETVRGSARARRDDRRGRSRPRARGGAPRGVAWPRVRTTRARRSRRSSARSRAPASSSSSRRPARSSSGASTR